MRPWYKESDISFDIGFGLYVKYFELTKVNFDRDNLEGFVHLKDIIEEREYELQFYGGPVYAQFPIERNFEYHGVVHTPQIEVKTFESPDCNKKEYAFMNYLIEKVHNILLNTVVGVPGFSEEEIKLYTFDDLGDLA